MIKIKKTIIEDLKSSPLYLSLSDDIARARKVLQLYIAAGDDYYAFVRKQVGFLTKLRVLRKNYLDLHLSYYNKYRDKLYVYGLN